MDASLQRPWFNEAASRSFFGFLTGSVNDIAFLPDDPAYQNLLVEWLIEQDLGSLAAARSGEFSHELAGRLLEEKYKTTAENSLHWNNLRQIDERFSEIGLTAVLLKGAALANTVYDGLEQRAMADVDIWLEAQQMRQGCAVLLSMDFDAVENVNRPFALQVLSGGEVQFYSREGIATLVELHLSPFEGWWLRRTADIDTAVIWERKQPLAEWKAFYQLAAEDMIIHLAVHLAIGHQFGDKTMRTFVDIALNARERVVDWQVLLERARKWRVATAVWLVLYHVQQLIGTPGLDEVLAQLQPAAWRRHLLLSVISPESVLAGKDIREERERYRLLLLLVDRPQDAIRLVYRTLWPEKAWLAARYGDGMGNWQHFRRTVVRKDI